jgi:3-oxoacyl-[acyl-carrier-protein] synthase III
VTGTSAGIRAAAYYLPTTALTVESLGRAGKLESSTARLRDFGFRAVRVAGRASAYDLAEQAVGRLLRRARLAPDAIDVLLYTSALPERAPPPRAARDPIALFRYPATRLQYRFGMTRAEVIGLAQAGCVSFLSALRVARDMIAAEPAIHRVLCVGSDALPAGGRREVLYNLISDGSCAAVVERDSPINRIVAYAQVTKGFYWDSRSKGTDIIAAYFPTARAVIGEALDRARLRMADIRFILPHNVNRRSWDVLLELVGARKSQFFGRNIGRKGHTIAADGVINLEDAVGRGLVKRGDYVLLFTFGFGAHWACMILQH